MMPSGPTIQLQLPDLYVGQILDGLEVLAEQWEDTARVLAEDDFGAVEVMIHECTDASEATSIAKLYRQISREVREQL